MSEVRSVHARAAAGATPIFVLSEGAFAVFAGSTESGSLVLSTMAESDAEDSVVDDIAAGLAALEEPVVASWESVKERLGL